MRVVSMKIEIACDFCGKTATLPPNAVNHMVLCPHCRNIFRATPGNEPYSEPPAFTLVMYMDR
jgi:uncharacterized paraquat-inducible protein A